MHPVPRALICGVFGTLVDWHGGVARELRRLLGVATGEADALADARRDEYQPAMQEVRAGRIGFCKLDVLHRRNLDQVLERRGRIGLLTDLSAARNAQGSPDDPATAA